MKIFLLPALALTLATPVAVTAAETAAPTAHACCAATPAPKASCCAASAEPAAAAAVPLPARSIYRLGATWTDDAGRPVNLAALRGRPVVITMFFASCSYACPILVSDMQRLRAALPAEARADTQFVLVSFDTARDTAAALRAYRERAGLDAGWTLLRGEEADVQELAMVLGVKYQRDARGDFAHSNLITVLNAAGEIVHQRSGLQGEVVEAARAVSVAAR